MKKKLLIFLLMIFILTSIAVMTGFTNNKEKHDVERLLNKRTDILQNTLLNKITEDEGTKQLRVVEIGELYSDDCKMIELYENSDFDIVTDMKIKTLEEKSNVLDIKTYLAEIEWTCSSYEGINSYQLTHYIGVKDCGDTYKLMTFEPSENINLSQ